jgi:hypothetical protein
MRNGQEKVRLEIKTSQTEMWTTQEEMETEVKKKLRPQ